MSNNHPCTKVRAKNFLDNLAQNIFPWIFFGSGGAQVEFFLLDTKKYFYQCSINDNGFFFLSGKLAMLISALPFLSLPTFVPFVTLQRLRESFSDCSI